ncbi:MAG: hypothetical protein WC521_08065 [Bdellovibrionales bacterium]
MSKAKELFLKNKNIKSAVSGIRTAFSKTKDIFTRYRDINVVLSDVRTALSEAKNNLKRNKDFVIGGGISLAFGLMWLGAGIYSPEVQSAGVLEKAFCIGAGLLFLGMSGVLFFEAVRPPVITHCSGCSCRF